MGKTMRGLAWVLFALFLVHDLYSWGGLAITPDFGTKLREQASLRSPLAATYLFAGRKTVEALHRRDAAVAYAAGQMRPTLFTEPGPPEVSRLTMSNILKFSMARKRIASIRNGITIGSVMDQNCRKGDARSTSAAS